MNCMMTLIWTLNVRSRIFPSLASNKQSDQFPWYLYACIADDCGRVFCIPWNDYGRKSDCVDTVDE